ncbi:MAG: helical backbone metal receptor [Candidatus Eremiobacteraeota bacterium]|nr:helical backbone metal receptor [Candidatus Eremiobacteraeota bacterium]
MVSKAAPTLGRIRAALTALAASLVLGCASRPPSDQPARLRVVSLAPSLTEIAYAIGAGSELVADTRYDDYPAAATRLPHVADLAGVDLERLAALHPSVVLALHDQERQAGPIQSRLAIPVVYLPNRSLADLFADVSGVGLACGRPAQARALAQSLRARIQKTAVRAARRAARPRLFFLLGLPGFTAGHQSFIDDLIRLAGARNIAAGAKQPYPDMSAEAVAASDPQIIIVARDVAFGESELRRQPWRSTAAVRRGAVVRPPSDDIVERDGPRIVTGLEWLASVVGRYAK